MSENNNETKTCPYCGEEIKANAIKCRYCGEFLDENKKENSNTKEKKKNWFARHPKMTLILIALVLGYITSESLKEYESNYTPSNNQETLEFKITPECEKNQECKIKKIKEYGTKYLEEYEVELWSFCKKAMKQKLKSPSTADFPLLPENSSVYGQYIIINGYVDAQNSFGAEVRTNFKCTYKFDDETKGYIIEDLQLN